ncbi:MAG: DNA mismatch repair protein MutS [bacterium]|nr:DNA mismatch repair protein MutS [bacterium]
MRQFYEIKREHPDKILFFRMGDFYEMFGDDAVKAAPILGISLTTRSHGEADKIPLAGMPHHSADKYLAKLLKHGEKVVIVEQVEDPRKAKGLVKREVVEILTPGTATIDTPEMLSDSLCLAALFLSTGKKLGLAALDLSTGAFIVDEGSAVDVAERLRVLEPSEILCPENGSFETISELTSLGKADGRLTRFGEWNFDQQSAERDLNELFGTGTLDGFGVQECKGGVIAAGAILRYLRENHRLQLDHIQRLSKFDNSEQMTLDYSTVRNLELVTSTSTATEENTLFEVMNRCSTAAGARKLRQSILHPFKQRAPIERRLSGVTELIRNRDLCHDIRVVTGKLPDLEKLAGRLGIGKLNPRQAAAIGQAIHLSDELRRLLVASHSPHLSQIGSTLPEGKEIVDRLREALVDEPPLTSLKGSIIRAGFSSDLDRLNDSIRDARHYIGSLQKTERERTGISTLKVGFNKVFGYYIEVSRIQSANVPQEYIRKQTLVNAERFITPELKEKEDLILSAEEKIFALETELFQELVDFLSSRMADLLHTGRLLAEIDLVSALADLAVERGYCRPELFEDDRLEISNGRHPVIEQVLPTGSFVANDVAFASDHDRIHILTGPNMSGKSTYLRQIGLIVIMAQLGSYVPADKVELGLVDRVFTRVGALDNLARGQSTFLVEMVETANILHNATDHSLVLLDEVGRGTSTFDGMSIAWAVVEFIEEKVNCRTLFATHYHELTGMAERHQKVSNYQVAVKKWESSVIFLHQIIPGGCDDSYGIEVAKLAGLPRPAITRANQILKLLESGKFNQSKIGKGIFLEKSQPTLFDPQPSEIEKKITDMDLDNMTPMDALNILRQFKDDLN